jgi:hypothetical protein
MNAMKKASKGGVLQIDGTNYHWSVLRTQTYCGSNFSGNRDVGMAIEVETEGSHRSLILQFDHVQGHRCMSKHMRFKIPDGQIIEHIRKAMQSGWDPESRGKPFMFHAGKPN